MLTMGLTGGTAAGKSTVLNYFKSLGAKIIDCDRVVHDRMRNGTVEHRKIVRRFGSGILAKGGEIDRAKLRSKILNANGETRKRLEFLEKTLHPGVKKAVQSRIRSMKRRKGLMVIEATLLFESGMADMVDRTVVVAAPAAARARWAKRRGVSAGTLRTFSSRQWPEKRKIAEADYVIRNDGTKSELRSRVGKVFNALKKEEKGGTGVSNN